MKLKYMPVFMASRKIVKTFDSKTVTLNYIKCLIFSNVYLVWGGESKEELSRS